MARDLKETHKEVRGWLQQVFGNATIPQHEINQRTVTVLYQLMQRCEERDREGQLQTEDFSQKAAEYNAEANRLAAIVQGVGLSPSSLSQSGNVSLRILSNIAQTLDLRGASYSNCYVAITDLKRVLMQVEDKRHAETLLNQKLFNKTKTAMIKSESLKKAMISLEEQAEQQGPQLEDKTRQAGFYQSKTREYYKQLEALEAELSQAGVDQLLYHQSLVKLHQDLESLDSKLAPLKAKLDSFQDLPPNVSLARVKIEETKRDLAAMETELSRHIDMMHM